jgi:voltage-dependent potassium channel beta subunit
MEYRNLGASGLRVSRLALGSWLTFGQHGTETAHELVDLALASGINFLDTADVYDNGLAEEMLGEILSTRNRADLVLATKLYFPMSDNVNDQGLSRKHIFESIDASLSRLNTDYIDLYQCHRYDEDVPLIETVRAMGDLMRAGKILYWGTSCWTAAQLRDACQLCDRLNVPRPISEQPPYNMLSREIEAEVLPTCAELGIGVINWSPLAQGFLTGKYKSRQGSPEGTRGADDNIDGFFLNRALQHAPAFERLAAIEKVAAQFEIKLPILALAWCLRRPELTSVILGASKTAQLQQNLEALAIEWTPELDQACEQALAGPPLEL